MKTNRVILAGMVLIAYQVGLLAQKEAELTVHSEPQQIFHEFGFSVSPENNAYMKGRVTDDVRDEFGKILFEDMNTKFVRLWYNFDLNTFDTAFIRCGFAQEARKHGVEDFLLAPIGYFPSSVKCGKYLCKIQEYADMVAKDIRDLQDKYNVRIDATGIINEPGAGNRDDILKEDYVKTLMTFRKTLDHNGLQHVKIIALEHWSPSDSSSLEFAETIAADPEASKILDGYATHSYGFAIDRAHAEIALKNGWDYWVTEAGGAKSGSDIAARFLNDLNNAATHWTFFLGPATAASAHTLAAVRDGKILKSFHYYTVKQISTSFLPGTQMRHVTSSVDGDMIYQRTGFPDLNAAAGIRPDGKWVIGISNITDEIHKKTDTDINVTLYVPELKHTRNLQFDVIRTRDNTDIIDKPDGTLVLKRGKGNIIIKKGEVVTLTESGIKAI